MTIGGFTTGNQKTILVSITGVRVVIHGLSLGDFEDAVVVGIAVIHVLFYPEGEVESNRVGEKYETEEGNQSEQENYF